MQRPSAAEYYLNRGPGVPMATLQQTFPTGTSAWEEDLRRRAEVNEQADRSLAEAYNSRVTPSSGGPAFRSAAAPREEQGRLLDPGGGAPPGGGYDPYQDLQQYGGPGGEIPLAQTAPARNLGGAPQAPEVPSQAPSVPFENTDEYTRDIPGVSTAMQHSEQFKIEPVRVALPPPYNSPESILTTFGENPDRGQIRRMLGFAFHPDRNEGEGTFGDAVNAVNNAYGRYIIGKGKRRKYMY
jgi:hypothetical protein